MPRNIFFLCDKEKPTTFSFFLPEIKKKRERKGKRERDLSILWKKAREREVFYPLDESERKREVFYPLEESESERERDLCFQKRVCTKNKIFF
jgi:hypothetical protein